MKSDIEKTFKSLIEIVNTTKYTLSEIMKMKNQFIAYTGSPCLSELKWKFGYNPKTKQHDLDDGMGYIKRTGKDSNRKVYDLDFGPGIYLTSNKELACSWACTQMEDIAIGIDIPKCSRNGALHTFILDFSGLKVLDLSSNKYSVMNYLAVVLYNRAFESESDSGTRDIVNYILENYLPEDIDTYDVICGPRADSLYTATIDNFLNMRIDIYQLRDLIPLGGYGEQIALVSKKAIESIKYYEKPQDLSNNKELYFKYQFDLAKKDNTKHEEISKAIPKDYTIADIMYNKSEDVKNIKLISSNDKYNIIKKMRGK